MGTIEPHSFVEHSSGQLTMLSACTNPINIKKYFVRCSVCFFQHAIIIDEETEICKQQVINNIITVL